MSAPGLILCERCRTPLRPEDTERLARGPRLLAIDPGNEHSAYLIHNPHTGLPVRWAKVPNGELRELLRDDFRDCDLLAIEQVASYGMAVGSEVFATCVWAGRFIEAWVGAGGPGLVEVFRREVKLHLCGSARARDANVRQALIDRFGPGKEQAVGLKKAPGPLYGLSGDCWAALGVAVTVADSRQFAKKAAA